jgi:hypothetical protein
VDQGFDFFGGGGLDFQRFVICGVAEDALDVLLRRFSHLVWLPLAIRPEEIIEAGDGRKKEVALVGRSRRATKLAEREIRGRTRSEDRRYEAATNARFGKS